MKSFDPLECDQCGKTLRKRVCLLEIADQVISDEYGVEDFTFCGKPCALKWRDKNTSFDYQDAEVIQEARFS